MNAQIADVKQKLGHAAASPALVTAQVKWEERVSADPAHAAARKGVPKEILAIIDIAEVTRRTKEQAG